MISGYYLGELLRLVLVDLHHQGHIFNGQAIRKLNEPFIMDTSFPARIEEDPFENLCETGELFNSLGVETTVPERELIRRICELIGTRAARLSVCSIAAICKKEVIRKPIALLMALSSLVILISVIELHEHLEIYFNGVIQPPT